MVFPFLMKGDIAGCVNKLAQLAILDGSIDPEGVSHQQSLDGPALLLVALPDLMGKRAAGQITMPRAPQRP